jgi:hypothetical protein
MTPQNQNYCLRYLYKISHYCTLNEAGVGPRGDRGEREGAAVPLPEHVQRSRLVVFEVIRHLADRNAHDLPKMGISFPNHPIGSYPKPFVATKLLILSKMVYQVPCRLQELDVR